MTTPCMLVISDRSNPSKSSLSPLEYMLMWTLIWSSIVLGATETECASLRKYVLMAPLHGVDVSQHWHNCSSCLQSCRFQTALGQACSFQDQTCSFSRIGIFVVHDLRYFNMEFPSKIPGILFTVHIQDVILFTNPNPILTFSAYCLLGLSVVLLNWHASISCLDLRTIHKQYHQPLKYLQCYRYLGVKWWNVWTYLSLYKSHVWSIELGRIRTNMWARV